MSSPQLAKISRLEALLSHASVESQIANACYILALRCLLINWEKPVAVKKALAFQEALNYAKSTEGASVVTSWLEEVSSYVDNREYKFYGSGLSESFKMPMEFLCSPSCDYVSVIKRVLSIGGDVDTNGMTTGVFLGACFGVEGIPQVWRNAVLTSSSDLIGQVRPPMFHPVTAKSLIDKVLCCAPNSL